MFSFSFFITEECSIVTFRVYIRYNMKYIKGTVQRNAGSVLCFAFKHVDLKYKMHHTDCFSVTATDEVIK